MKKIIFKGSGVAIITPFINGVIDYDSLKKLLDYQISNKTDAIIVCGTTGESATLSDFEKIELINYTVQYVNGRIPVIAGTGSNSTLNAINMTKEARKAGADGVLLVTPFYNKASENGMIAHYSAIAESCDIPAILYNVPSRTGCNLTPNVYKKLINYTNIVAVKEASGNISQITEILSEFGNEISVYSGNDDQIIPILSLGGKGVISVLANILPRQTHEICKLWFENKIEESKDLQLKLFKLIRSLFIEVNPIPVKYSLSLMNYCTKEIRLPLTEPSEKTKLLLNDVLKEYNIIR